MLGVLRNVSQGLPPYELITESAETGDKGHVDTPTEFGLSMLWGKPSK